MTKRMLEEYRSKKDEIEELKYKLDHLGEGDSMIGNSVINDYRTGFPRPQSVVGVDWDKVDWLHDRYCKQLEILQRECTEVEQWIEDISDSLTRRIFRMHYIDGVRQKQIAEAVHLDKSRVSRKIDEYIKNATKATNATL